MSGLHDLLIKDVVPSGAHRRDNGRIELTFRWRDADGKGHVFDIVVSAADAKALAASIERELRREA